MGKKIILLRRAAAVVLACSGLSLALAGALATPGIQAVNEPAPAQKSPHAKPSNLKVLPPDISSEELDKLMHGYEKQLGVPCGYCHEQNAENKEINYASDENPVKQTARFMISMTSDINKKYLAQLGDRRYAPPITCGNCHRGVVEPPEFEPKP